MSEYCVNSDNPASSNIVRKNIFPTVCQALFATGTKGDVRVAAADALKALQNCCPMGERVWSWVSDHSQQEELKKILGGGR